jgi:hypothetical protein
MRDLLRVSEFLLGGDAAEAAGVSKLLIEMTGDVRDDESITWAKVRR